MSAATTPVRDPILDAPLAEQRAWWSSVDRNVAWQGSEPLASTVATVLRNLEGNPAPDEVDADLARAAAAGDRVRLQRLADARLIAPRHGDAIWDAYRSCSDDRDGSWLRVLLGLPAGVWVPRMLAELEDCVRRSRRDPIYSSLAASRHPAAARVVIEALGDGRLGDDWLYSYNLRLPAEGAEDLLAAARRCPDGEALEYQLAVRLAEDGIQVADVERFLPSWRSWTEVAIEAVAKQEEVDDEWCLAVNRVVFRIHEAGLLFPPAILGVEVRGVVARLPLAEVVQTAAATLASAKLPIDDLDLRPAAAAHFARGDLWETLSRAGRLDLFPPEELDIGRFAIAKLAKVVDHDNVRLPPGEAEVVWRRPLRPEESAHLSGTFVLLRWRPKPEAGWSQVLVGPFSDGPRPLAELLVQFGWAPEGDTVLGWLIEGIEEQTGVGKLPPEREDRSDTILPQERAALRATLALPAGPEQDAAVRAACAVLVAAVRAQPAMVVALADLAAVPTPELLDGLIGPDDVLRELTAGHNDLTLPMLDRWRQKRDWRALRQVADGWSEFLEGHRGFRHREDLDAFAQISGFATRLARCLIVAEFLSVRRLLEVTTRRIAKKEGLPDSGSRLHELFGKTVASAVEPVRHRLADILETEEYLPMAGDEEFLAWYRRLPPDHDLRLYAADSIHGIEEAAASPSPVPAASVPAAPPRRSAAAGAAPPPPPSAPPRRPAGVVQPARPAVRQPARERPASGGGRNIGIIVLVVVVLAILKALLRHH